MTWWNFLALQAAGAVHAYTHTGDIGRTSFFTVFTGLNLIAVIPAGALGAHTESL
jgi:hypothetical protein